MIALTPLECAVARMPFRLQVGALPDLALARWSHVSADQAPDRAHIVTFLKENVTQATNGDH